MDKQSLHAELLEVIYQLKMLRYPVRSFDRSTLSSVERRIQLQQRKQELIQQLSAV